MALKVLMLRKKINDKKKEQEALRSKSAEFVTREAELEKAIEEAESDEERQAVEEEVEKFENEKAEHDDAVKNIEEELEKLEADLEAEERSQNMPAPKPAKKEERKVETMANIKTRGFFRGMDVMQRNAIFEQDDVKGFMTELRSAIKEKRAVTGAGELIPEVFLGLLRQNMTNYSKLYKHVDVRRIGGDGHLVIQGAPAEAVWTEMCANINELSLAFYGQDVNCWKVAGYYAMCNAILEDSEIDLAEAFMDAMLQGIGLAIDKAILYGTGTKMPFGIMTRLVQTSQPAAYPANARPWADLHTSNIKSIAANKTGAELFKLIITHAGASKGKYARGSRVWAMNETTRTALLAEALTVDSSGAIVAGMNSSMPVIGGVIETLEFIPNNVIIGGYFENYLLAERAGSKFMSSEHVRFLADQTVFKATARYDGAPEIAEAFVAIGIAGTTPNATMTFADDTANS